MSTEQNIERLDETRRRPKNERQTERQTDGYNNIRTMPGEPRRARDKVTERKNQRKRVSLGLVLTLDRSGRETEEGGQGYSRGE